MKEPKQTFVKKYSLRLSCNRSLLSTSEVAYIPKVIIIKKICSVVAEDIAVSVFNKR
jgi:hypothetical protein